MTLLKLILLISIAFQTLGGTSDHSDQQYIMKEIRHVIAKREWAINRKNWRIYRQTIINQSHYLQEQKRWFADAIRYIDPYTYDLRLKRIELKGKRTVQVWIEQRYRKQRRKISNVFPLIFVQTSKGWQDSDFPFYCLNQAGINVCYTDQSLEEKAHVALDIARRARYVLHQRFSWHPERIKIKLYHQPAWFRQSVKLSLPNWAGGWNEARQSIKLVTQREPLHSFAAGIVHEETHQMVSDLTKDNAAYWLQEGAAMYYEAKLLPGLHEEVPEHRLIHPLSLEQLQKMNLEQLNDTDASRYYISCYRWFSFLLNHFGEGKMKQLLTKLGRYSTIDVDSSDKISILNKRTQLELMRTFGQTFKELSSLERKDRIESQPEHVMPD
ncbi:hypothetical protein SAMN05444392_1065 [Seinonella peptonophila]|uniref:Peptidase MA-like domain-containing protein n=1 Tax=Seinonella peptonophila TaxID=112248 RepID=A0A1M4Y2M2_9BACL|nr:hypothetical protein [Seinonella peptonophila]SHF00077.1 hypothetical protein SAMN05444392_1065 [Seinonella peptonophila]